MKSFVSIATALALLSAPALAQDKQSSKSAAQQEEHIKGDQYRGSKVIGAEVYGNDAQKVGKVSDIILGEDAKISAIVVDVGGTLGMGGKNIAVPMSEIRMDDFKDGRLTLKETKAELEQHPKFVLDRTDKSSTSSGSSTGTATPGSSQGQSDALPSQAPAEPKQQ